MSAPVSYTPAVEAPDGLDRPSPLKQLYACLYRHLADRNILLHDHVVLDLGAGDAEWVRFLRRQGLRAVALDRQPPGPETGAPRGLVARVEALPLRRACLDVITALNAWHWFPRPDVGPEIRRALRSGGRLIVVYMDWAPRPGAVTELADECLRAANPDWNPKLRRQVHSQGMIDMRRIGLSDTHMETVPLVVHHTADDWIRRLVAGAAVHDLSDEQAGRFEEEQRTLVAERFPGAMVPVPFEITCVSAANR